MLLTALIFYVLIIKLQGAISFELLVMLVVSRWSTDNSLLAVNFFKAVALFDVGVLLMIDGRKKKFNWTGVEFIVPCSIFTVEGFINNQFGAGFGVRSETDDAITVKVRNTVQIGFVLKFVLEMLDMIPWFEEVVKVVIHKMRLVLK